MEVQVPLPSERDQYLQPSCPASMTSVTQIGEPMDTNLERLLAAIVDMGT